MTGRTILLSIGIVVVLVVVIMLAAPSAAGLLSARVAPKLPFKVIQVGETGEPHLIAGQYNKLVWDVSPSNQKLYPGENIALCPTHVGQLNKDCIVLHQYVGNSGQADLYVPPYVEAGSWNVVMTAWDVRDRLLLTHAVTVPAQVSEQAQVEQTVTAADATVSGLVERTAEGISLKNVIASAGEKLSDLEGKIVDVVVLARNEESAASAPLSAPEEAVDAVLREQVGEAAAPLPTPVSESDADPAAAPSTVSTPPLAPHVIITASSVASGESIPFVVSNVEVEEIDCIAATVNGQAATISGQLKMCPQ